MIHTNRIAVENWKFVRIVYCGKKCGWLKYVNNQIFINSVLFSYVWSALTPGPSAFGFFNCRMSLAVDGFSHAST